MLFVVNAGHFYLFACGVFSMMLLLSVEFFIIFSKSSIRNTIMQSVKQFVSRSGSTFCLQSLTAYTNKERVKPGRLSETQWCINILFAYCKGGNFNIHIWAWFGYFIC